jgi:hypothetical protein
MRINLSDQTLDALALVISGGSQNDPTPSIGHYRAGWQLVEFFKPFNVEVDLKSYSRLPGTRQALSLMAFVNDQADLRRVVERAADPRDFIQHPEKHTAVMDYLNRFLAYDDLELRMEGRVVRLVEVARVAAAAEALSAMAERIDFDTARRDLDRALQAADRDPEIAVTAACAIIESVCRSILVELGLELPAKQDIGGLYRAVRDPLGLDPAKEGVAPEIVSDVKAVLSGLVTSVQGIGALRTHVGGAHGKERGFTRIDPRIAKLAIHSASAVALFLIETWQVRFPGRRLPTAK